MKRPGRNDEEASTVRRFTARTLAVVVTTVCTTLAAVAQPDKPEAAQDARPLLSDDPYYVPYVITKDEAARDDPLTTLGTGTLLSDYPYYVPYAIVKDGTAWNDPLIFVCWEDSARPYAAERKMVEKAVADSWGSENIVVFSGWKPCVPDNHGIRIDVADVQPVTIGLGKELNEHPKGMVLNFTFQNFPLPCPAAQRHACIKIIAIHEFGHALGFTHEEWQPKSDEKCLLERNGPPGNRSLTPWDPNSVMGGCLPKYGYRGQLSDNDRAGLRKFYAAKSNP